MPKPILYHAETDLYLEYSTIVDAPTTIAVPRDQMRACNRAGRDETEMSYAQFVKFWFVDRGGDCKHEELPVGDLVREYDEHGVEVSVTINGVPVVESPSC